MPGALAQIHLSGRHFEFEWDIVSESLRQELFVNGCDWLFVFICRDVVIVGSYLRH